MRNTIKVGDRVNVTFNVTESWESEAGLINGRVFELRSDKQSIGVAADYLSKKMPYHRWLGTGHYSTIGYKIELTPNEKA